MLYHLGDTHTDVKLSHARLLTKILLIYIYHVIHQLYLKK